MRNREDLINELSELYKMRDTLWEFHPNNPNCKEIITSYLSVENNILELEKFLDSILD